MWYDPVFKVQKLNGTEVWRRRHYRVRRAEVRATSLFPCTQIMLYLPRGTQSLKLACAQRLPSPAQLRVPGCNAQVPGTFNLSVLDNGVTSKEVR